MGTTFSSIHVYSPGEITYPGCGFASFSDGWQTLISSETELSPKLARKMSKTIGAPVLWFCALDSDALSFSFYQNGKETAGYSDYIMEERKGILKIPELVGYASGEKRRLSNLLSCGDFDTKAAMLEEYFGVCLLSFEELIQTSDPCLGKIRDRKIYEEFQRYEKSFSGRNSPVKAELIYECVGKLFDTRFRDDTNVRTKKPGCFYIGFETPFGALHPVRFKEGRLEKIGEAEMLQGRIPRYHDDRFTVAYGSTNRVICTEKTPEAYCGKSIALPMGYDPFDFDSRGRLFLRKITGGNGMVIITPEGKITARFSLKGFPMAMDGAYVLTADSESGFAYYYNPKQHVRIYRLTEQ